MLIGAIEAGGTKFICATANEHLEIIERLVIATTTPEQTLAEVVAFFQRNQVKTLAIGAFGPVVVDSQASNYGTILNTPKRGWQNVHLKRDLQRALNHIPVIVQTDVNAAAYGEAILGAGADVASLLYLTIGTGIGGGYVVHGHFPSTLLHQEMGHIPITRNQEDHNEGVCPFHQDCLEGLASGHAIHQRTGHLAASLSPQDAFWQHWADYVAKALLTYTFTLSPHRIVLGGGVMQQQHLLAMIKERFLKLMNGYLDIEQLADGGIDGYIVPPRLAGDAGIIGALLLAKNFVE